MMRQEVKRRTLYRVYRCGSGAVWRTV